MDSGSVIAVPSSWSTYEAAGFMEPTLTAFLNIFQIGGAAKGKSVLIHGGGSGVGTWALYLQLSPHLLENSTSAAPPCLHGSGMS